MNTTAITTFNNEEFGNVRTYMLDGEPWFIGKDIATILSYTNTAKAIRDHVDEDDKLTERIVLSGQNRDVIFINESGFYNLILSSKMPRCQMPRNSRNGLHLKFYRLFARLVHIR